MEVVELPIVTGLDWWACWRRRPGGLADGSPEGGVFGETCMQVRRCEGESYLRRDHS